MSKQFAFGLAAVAALALMGLAGQGNLMMAPAYAWNVANLFDDDVVLQANSLSSEQNSEQQSTGTNTETNQATIQSSGALQSFSGTFQIQESSQAAANINDDSDQTLIGQTSICVLVC